MKKIEVDITIDTVGRRGDGVGRWQGRPVFVPRTLPGEQARVRLLEDRHDGIAAQLLGVQAPSAERAAPPCPFYDRCGGCSLQHWQVDAYRRWKAERLPEMLRRAGIVVGTWLPPVFIPDHTRRRATLAAVVENGRLRLGYHRARSHDIVDIPYCLLLTPRLRALVDGVRPHLLNLLVPHKPADIFVQDSGQSLDLAITGAIGPRGAPGYAEREALAELAEACGLARLGWRQKEEETIEVIVQRQPVLKAIGALTVELPPLAFMQPSAEGEEALIAATMAPVRAAGATRIADLFAGCGTFSGPLLEFGSVHAADSGDDAMQALRRAAGPARLTVERRNLFANPLSGTELDAFDAVLFDPPRMGAKEQASQLAQSDVPLVVGVSCNPVTFIRDALLLQNGGYALESMQVVDQFTWSAHLEMIGVFRRS